MLATFSVLLRIPDYHNILLGSNIITYRCYACSHHHAAHPSPPYVAYRVGWEKTNKKRTYLQRMSKRKEKRNAASARRRQKRANREGPPNVYVTRKWITKYRGVNKLMNLPWFRLSFTFSTRYWTLVLSVLLPYR